MAQHPAPPAPPEDDRRLDIARPPHREHLRAHEARVSRRSRKTDGHRRGERTGAGDDDEEEGEEQPGEREEHLDEPGRPRVHPARSEPAGRSEHEPEAQTDDRREDPDQQRRRGPVDKARVEVPTGFVRSERVVGGRPLERVEGSDGERIARCQQPGGERGDEQQQDEQGGCALDRAHPSQATSRKAIPDGGRALPGPFLPHRLRVA